MLPPRLFCVFLKDAVLFCRAEKKILQNAQRTGKRRMDGETRKVKILSKRIEWKQIFHVFNTWETDFLIGEAI